MSIQIHSDSYWPTFLLGIHPTRRVARLVILYALVASLSRGVALSQESPPQNGPNDFVNRLAEIGYKTEVAWKVSSDGKYWNARMKMNASERSADFVVLNGTSQSEVSSMTCGNIFQLPIEKNDLIESMGLAIAAFRKCNHEVPREVLDAIGTSLHGKMNQKVDAKWSVAYRKDGFAVTYKLRSDSKDDIVPIESSGLTMLMILWAATWV